MNALIVALGALLLNVATATVYTACSSEYGEVQSVTVTNCDASPCVLKVNTKPEISITFKSHVDSKDLKVRIYGVIGGVPLPFPGPQGSACEGSGIACPLKKDEVYTYRNSIDVKDSYPRIPVTVKYTLLDENSNQVVCVEIPSKIEA
ncbi:NPC intracellular cholesterol transporter 2-like [Centruroides vittatus]|uniref:NPC intracellular cholesterol transporter 2-like n=1 Tax=Centruroides vittatus TaxID=120091 RepID=UPI00350F2DAC